jgi:RNA polymerase sigma-70 factor (ECF subfamily)
MPGGHDYERIFREDGPTLWRTIYSYTAGRRQMADDAVAEAFTRAIAHDGAIRRPVPWLYKTAIRLAGEDLRRERRDEPTSEESGEDSVANADLLAALRRLSPSQRAAVFLHYEGGFPVKDVATRMGTSVSSVKVHLFRGRNRLRELLGDEDE